MTRPLYLSAVAGMRVLWVAPALRIHRPGSADRLVPLSRVSRIIQTGVPDWSMDALLACSDRGVTVTFLHEDGRPRGLLVGQRRRAGDLASCISEFLDRADWTESYDNWRRWVWSLAVRSTARRLSLARDRDWSRSAVKAFVDDELEVALGHSVVMSIQRRLLGYCRGLAAAVLTEHGLEAATLRLFDVRLDLVDDLAHLLHWDLQVALLHAARRSQLGRAPCDRPVVVFFEARAVRLHRLAQGAVNRLHRWLIELQP